MKEENTQNELHFEPLARWNERVVRRLFAKHEKSEKDDDRGAESERDKDGSCSFSISGSDKIGGRFVSR